MIRLLQLSLFAFLSCAATLTLAEGKLIGTSGATQVEGSAGGGIVPWAIIAGNGTRDENGAALHAGVLELDEFSMTTVGAAIGFHDRFELSVARLSFQPENMGEATRVNSFGLKAKLFGDLIFSSWPLVSVGLLHKESDFSDASFLPENVDESGTDAYFAATKVWLDGLFHLNTLINVTFRWTEANQLGSVGFGGDESAALQAELSTALFLNRHWVIGAEYRQKPDNIASMPEDDWKSIFLVYTPVDHLTLMAAFLDAGEITGSDDQKGLYIQVKGAF